MLQVFFFFFSTDFAHELIKKFPEKGRFVPTSTLNNLAEHCLLSVLG